MDAQLDAAEEPVAPAVCAPADRERITALEHAAAELRRGSKEFRSKFE